MLLNFEYFKKFKPARKKIYYLSLERNAGFPHSTEMRSHISPTFKASVWEMRHLAELRTAPI